MISLGVGLGDDGFRCVVVTGAPGIGLSTVLDLAAADAGQAGFAVIQVAGRHGALFAPMAPLIDAFPEMAGQIGPVSGGETLVDLVSIELVRRAEATPVLCVVDRPDLLDAGSVSALAAMTAGASGSNVSILIGLSHEITTMSVGVETWIAAMGRHAVIQRVDLPPLGDVDVRALLRGHAAKGQDLDVIVSAARGSPTVAIELASWSAAGRSGTPHSIEALARIQMAMLSPLGQQVIQYLAIAARPLDLEFVASVCGETEADVAVAVSGSCLCTVSDAAMHPCATTCWDAIRATLSAAEKRAIHGELGVAGLRSATTLHEKTNAARHLGLAGRSHQAVSLLEECADQLIDDGFPYEADRAFAHARSFAIDNDRDYELLKRQVQVACDALSVNASGLLGELRGAARRRADHETAWFATYEHLAQSGGDAPPVAGDDTIGWSARCSAFRALLDGDLRGAIRHDAAAIDIARKRGDRRLEALALAKSAVAHGLLGSLAEAVDLHRRSNRIARTQGLHRLLLNNSLDLSQTFVELADPASAVAECNNALEYFGSMEVRQIPRVIKAYKMYAQIDRGNVRQAYEDLLEDLPTGKPKGPHAPLVLAMWARVLIDAGDAVRARPIVDAAVEAAAKLEYESLLFEAQFEDARCRLLEGDIDEAVARAVELSINEPTSSALLAQWLGYVGVAFQQPRATGRASELIAMAPEVSVPQASHALAAARATTSSDGVGRTACEQASLAWRQHGFLLYANRLAIAAALMCDSMSDAARMLAAACTELRSLHATGDSEIAAALARERGVLISGIRRVNRADTLTPRERSIAELAAHGLSNAEIARQLHLSAGYVARRMSGVLTKAQIASRTEIAGMDRTQPDGVAGYEPSEVRSAPNPFN